MRARGALLLKAKLSLLPVLLASCTACSFFRTPLTYGEAELFYPQITTVRPELLDRRNVEVSLPDGNTLRGIAMVRPNPRATFIYFGGNAEHAQSATTKITQWAETYNVNVIFVDYRGYGASTGAPALKHLASDALAIYDGTTRFHGTAPIFVIGFSLGSLSATHLAANRPLSGLVLMAPVSSFSDSDMYPKEQKRRLLPRYKAPLARWANMRPAFEVPDGLEPMNNIGQVHAPLLLMHGNEDQIIPAKCGMNVYNKAKGKKTLLLMQGLGHNDLSLTSGQGAEYMAKFVDECLDLGY